MSPSLSKGTFYLTLSTFVFLGVGYVLQIIIGRAVDPAIYGTFGVAVYLLNTTEYVFTSGISQAISKFLAAHPEKGKSIVHTSLWLQIAVSIFFMAVTALSIPFISTFVHDASFEPLGWVIVCIIPFYSSRSFIQGILGGQRAYSAQARVRVVISLAKLFLVLMALWLHVSVLGVLIAYLLSALFGSLYGKKYIHPLEHEGTISFREILTYSISLTVFLVVFPLFVNVDVFLVKALLPSQAEAGYYVSATTLARAPFYLFTGLLIALLPEVARLKEVSSERLRKTVSDVMRYSILFLAPLSVLVAVTANKLLPLVFGSKYQGGAIALQILIISTSFLVLFRVCATVVVGMGRPHFITIASCVLLVVDVLLNLFLIPKYGIAGASYASLIVMSLGLLLVLFVLARYRLLSLPLKTLGLTTLSSFLVGVIALFAHSGLLLLFELGGLFGLHFLFLWITGEIQEKDFVRMRRILTPNKHALPSE